MDISLKITDITALGPLLLLFFGGLLVLLVETFWEKQSQKYGSLLTPLIIVVALISAYYAPASESPLLTPWLKFDHLSHLFNTFFLLIGLGASLLATSFLRRFNHRVVSIHFSYYRHYLALF